MLPFLLVLTACGGQHVHPLGLHDPRLPPDARRWIADAQDAVAVARAWRETTQDDLDAVSRWNRRLNDEVPWPAGSQAATAARELRSMTQARTEVARLELVKSEAELGLAEAKLVLVHAETSMRHDLAVYDLEPLRRSTEAARRRVEATVVALESVREALEKAITVWWKAYSAYLASGGSGEVLWVKQ